MVLNLIGKHIERSLKHNYNESLIVCLLGILRSLHSSCVLYMFFVFEDYNGSSLGL